MCPAHGCRMLGLTRPTWHQCGITMSVCKSQCLATSVTLACVFAETPEASDVGGVPLFAGVQPSASEVMTAFFMFCKKKQTPSNKLWMTLEQLLPKATWFLFLAFTAHKYAVLSAIDLFCATMWSHLTFVTVWWHDEVCELCTSLYVTCNHDV